MSVIYLAGHGRRRSKISGRGKGRQWSPRPLTMSPPVLCSSRHHVNFYAFTFNIRSVVVRPGYYLFI